MRQVPPSEQAHEALEEKTKKHFEASFGVLKSRLSSKICNVYTHNNIYSIRSV